MIPDNLLSSGAWRRQRPCDWQWTVSQVQKMRRETFHWECDWQWTLQSSFGSKEESIIKVFTCDLCWKRLCVMSIKYHENLSVCWFVLDFDMLFLFIWAVLIKTAGWYLWCSVIDAFSSCVYRTDCGGLQTGQSWKGCGLQVLSKVLYNNNNSNNTHDDNIYY